MVLNSLVLLQILHLMEKMSMLAAFSYLGENVKIGDNVKIYPNSYIGDNVQIGDNVTLFSGAKYIPIESLEIIVSSIQVPLLVHEDLALHQMIRVNILRFLNRQC